MTPCLYWQLFKVARVLLLFIHLMQEFFLLQSMDFILIDEEKHIREQNHMPRMYFFSWTLVYMSNVHYQSDFAFVHRQDIFIGQKVSLWKNICLTNKNPTVSIRRTKPKPLIFLLTNKCSQLQLSIPSGFFTTKRFVSQSCCIQGACKVIADWLSPGSKLEKIVECREGNVAMVFSDQPTSISSRYL